MVEALDFLTLKNALRLVVIVFMFGYCVFAFILSTRVKILADTLKTEKSGTMAVLAWSHFLMAIIGCVIVGILIML
jgi:hypothetical protein